MVEVKTTLGTKPASRIDDSAEPESIPITLGTATTGGEVGVFVGIGRGVFVRITGRGVFVGGTGVSVEYTVVPPFAGGGIVGFFVGIRVGSGIAVA